MSDSAEKQRLDKWLFCARLMKSRSLASALIEAGKVRVNRIKVDKPSYLIRIGDELTIALHNRIFIGKILSLAERRGPAPEARLLYEDLSPAPLDKSEQPLEAVIERGRPPNKKERRLAERLRNPDL